MLSDEKTSHIVHLMLNGLKKAGLVSIPDEGAAIREAKRVCMQFMKRLSACSDVARQRILSLKNPPPEYSAQWHNLFQQYYEEEMRRQGG